MISSANVPQSTGILPFSDVARLPAPEDNAAIATRRLEAGTQIASEAGIVTTDFVVLEGHRFAAHAIEQGHPLLSWGLPFGRALSRILPGQYLCNDKILKALRDRHVSFALPAAANFVDDRLPVRLDENQFQPGIQISAHEKKRYFQGYLRDEDRGVGTRNYIVLLGTTSRSAGFIRKLAQGFKEPPTPNIDGIVPIDHTELGGTHRPHNTELILRTLAGLMINPNVGAVLAVDFGNEPVNNVHLMEYLKSHAYPASSVIHEFISIGSEFENTLMKAAKIIGSWLPKVSSFSRSTQSIEHLRLGLQCGGSDAFSGISGNPLVGILSRETVAYGGSANLAETDELIGAESYVLENVRDLATARAFLETVARFQRWAGWHGHSAEGNPSGGNNYRGLYNISIKSIGAARKKDPRTRLDYVIDYGSPMKAPGFYFMDSPGNDLESIAGQVAAGCNMILFATGNGSITNFPFVPTIKIMTTTERFKLVRNEMDFNAGRYLDGEDLEKLGTEALDYMVNVASGQSSVGEKAGHSQVQLWREWQRSGPGPRTEIAPKLLDGTPVFTSEDFPKTELEVASPPPSQLGLILPTSLCSGQIAQMIAANLNQRIASGVDFGLNQFAALPHTEGCGNSAGESEQLFLRTMAGYLVHQRVARGLLLEHGCEKTHNDAFRNTCAELGIGANDFGFASIQLDGGIDAVSKKIESWFRSHPRGEYRDQKAFSLGFIGAESNEMLQPVFAQIIAGAGTVVLADSLQRPTLAYGQRFSVPGLHIMETHSDNLVENLTGLGATGVDIMLVYSDSILAPANPIVPVLQIASSEKCSLNPEQIDLLLPAEPSELLNLLKKTSAEEYLPRSAKLGNFGFQISRGRFGISL